MSKMKRTEEEKKMICQVLDEFVKSIEDAKSNSISHLEQFKKENDLLSEDLWDKWLVYDEYPSWLGYFDRKTQKYYGISGLGEWFNIKTGRFKPAPTERPATPEEILSKLSAIAVTMGYGKFQSECRVNNDTRGDIDFENCQIYLNDLNYLYITDKNDNLNCILKDGMWAKIINPKQQKIDKLQKKIDKLKSKL